MRRGIKTRQICFPLFLLVIYFSLISHPECAGHAGCVPYTIIELPRFLPVVAPQLPRALESHTEGFAAHQQMMKERACRFSREILWVQPESDLITSILVHWPKFVTNLHLPARESGKCGLTVPKRKKEMEFGKHIALSLPQTHSKVWTETLI